MLLLLLALMGLAAVASGTTPNAVCALGACSTAPARSCKDLWQRTSLGNRLAWVKPLDSRPAYQARCARRGWELVLKLNGSSDTLAYDSALWTSHSTLGLRSRDHNARDVPEAKFRGYNEQPLNQILVQPLPAGAARLLRLPTRVASLRSLMRGTPSSSLPSASGGLSINWVVAPLSGPRARMLLHSGSTISNSEQCRVDVVCGRYSPDPDYRCASNNVLGIGIGTRAASAGHVTGAVCDTSCTYCERNPDYGDDIICGTDRIQQGCVVFRDEASPAATSFLVYVRDD